MLAAVAQHVRAPAVVAQSMVFGDPMSAAERDRMLFDSWKAGDAGARSQLICRLGGIARRVAQRYHGVGELDDLISVAMIGVCEAVGEWRGEGTLRSLVFARAGSRVHDYLRAELPSRETVSIHAFSSTELIDEWRAPFVQEDATLLGQVRTIATRALQKQELDIIALRMRDMSGPVIARRLGTDRFRVSERETAAMRKLTDAVSDEP